MLSVFIALTVLALAFIPVARMGIAPLLVLYGLLGFFLFAIQPFYQDAVAVHTPADTRGLSYGYTYFGEFGLDSASIAIGAFLLDAFSLGAFFAMLATFSFAGAVLSVSLLVLLDRFDAPRVTKASSDD